MATLTAPPNGAALARRVCPPTFVSIALVWLSFAWKYAGCASGELGPGGNSALTFERLSKYACFTDIQALWGSRALGEHLFPFISGEFTAPNVLSGGIVEYPVLGGLLIWLLALPAQTDGAFLLSNAIFFSVVAAVTTAILAIVAERRVWMWASAPALLMYSVYNWDLPPVLLTVAGVIVVVAGPPSWSPRRTAITAAILFGIGGALKLYPLLFLLPLVLWLLYTHRPHGVGRFDRESLVSAIWVAVSAGAVLAVVNVPFMLIHLPGWLAPLQFQGARPIDNNGLSIWYWTASLFRDVSGPASQRVLTILATVSTAGALGAIAYAGWRRAKRDGMYPFLAVCAALLCAYMAFNKVHSPQYILWLIPFFVLLNIRVRWVLVYYAVDVAVFVGWYRVIYADVVQSGEMWPQVALAIGVWGRFAVLLALIVVFLRADHSAGLSGLRARRRVPANGAENGSIAALSQRLP